MMNISILQDHIGQLCRQFKLSTVRAEMPPLAAATPTHLP